MSEDVRKFIDKIKALKTLNENKIYQYETTDDLVNSQKQMLHDGFWNISFEDISDLEFIGIDKLKMNYGEYPEDNKIASIVNKFKNNIPIEPIVLNRNNTILDGHHRFEAAKLLGIKEVPVIFINNSLNEQSYPLEDKGKWYGDSDYETNGGTLVQMTPDEFLNKAKVLTMDIHTRENVEDLKQHILNGGRLDPLVLYSSDKSDVRNSDGRHRAIAAKELGMESVPVVDFTNRRR